MKEDYSGAQAATVESKPGKKKLKKIKKEEREKTKGLSVTQLAFFHCSGSGSVWIRINLALLNPNPHQSSKYGSGSRFRSHKFFKNEYGLHWS